MVVGATRGDQAISARVQRTIQSIREIVRDHSDADIYAVLKESNMDPNETAQKLLNQDPFHEVKRKRDKKKESTGYRNPVEARKHTEHNVQLARSYTSWDRNTRRGDYARNPDAGISKEYRIVRDNRSNQAGNRDLMPESSQHLPSSSEKVVSHVPTKSSTGTLNDRKHSSARNSDKHVIGNRSFDSGFSHAKDAVSNHGNRAVLNEETQSPRPVSISKSKAQEAEVFNTSQASVTLISTNSEIGMHSSSTDPIHVPSTNSRPARTIGAIRRDVGVVGSRRQSSNHPASQPSGDVSSSTESSRQPAVMSKSNQFTQISSAETNMPSIFVNKSFSSIQYNSKQHQQSVGHHKAMQPNMEWKPKPIQKTSITSSVLIGSVSVSSTSTADNTAGSHLGDMSGLSEKLSEANVSEALHVIIPQHLRVPEADRVGLMFGSFGAESDSTRTSTPMQVYENSGVSIDERSASVSAGSNGDVSGGDQGDIVDTKGRAPRYDSPASSAESEQPQPLSIESPRQNIKDYADIGVVQSNDHPYSSTEPELLQNSPSLPGFSAYDTQEDVPFFRTTMEDNMHEQGFPSQPEALSSHIVNSCPPSTASLFQQQQHQLQQQQQQQAIAQLYPQVQISHFPNFVPYRHVFSPVYMPPMAVPNYSNNPAYPHPSSGNSYVLMPGGSSHIASGGMKYTASQYKPVPGGSPTAYGNYTNPAGFAIGPPGTLSSATGLEDVSRIKYKDNNLYVPNPQAEASDIWVQTPRELPSLQSQPFYNFSGQAPHAAYAGHASFNAAAQSSPVQYPSLYHPPQPASIANPHHLVHQQVPPVLGGNVGVGVAAPAPQVGTYQQPQLGHLNWTANF